MEQKNNLVSRNSKIAWQIIDQKIVLVSPKQMKIHILSGTGSHIWNHLKEPTSVENLVEKVVEEYDTTKEKAREDVNTFLEQLSKEELLEV